MSWKRFLRRCVTYFVNGTITILPIVLVGYVVYQSFEFMDNLLGRFIRMRFGDYIPGLGLLITVILITGIGMIASTYFSRLLLGWMELVLSRIPFVKSLYSIIKETIESLLGEKKAFSKVALLQIPGTEMRILGFVTSEHVEFLLPDAAEEHLAVYVPQSFQMAGTTLIVPRASVTLLDVPVEQAMSFVLSAGVSSPGAPAEGARKQRK
ncbi:MAG: hypothetical protein JWN30_1683 [Bacilli bacterium]|nr:hypothetical protein [Bacilli bacterium]